MAKYKLEYLWLDGYTPDYSTVVWMGYPNRRVPMTSVHGEAQQGGRLPADIWHAYMSAVTEGKPCVPFRQGASLSYRPFFGKLATTGRATSSGSGENEYSETYAPRYFAPRAGRRGKGRSPTRPGAGGHGGAPETPAPPPAPPPAEPQPAQPAPPAEPPGQGRTGGAGPKG